MITIPTIYFFVLLAVFLLALLGVGAHYYLRGRRNEKQSYGDFEILLQRLSKVDRHSVALIARDLIDDESNLDPSQIWPLIGGMDGLEALEQNCTVLQDLVVYVQQWYPEALAVAEQLRLNTREMRWHIERLKSAEKNNRLEAFFPDYAQRAVAIYYMMTRHVLVLYEQLNVPGVELLERVL
jgi:hypothetical protein